MNSSLNSASNKATDSFILQNIQDKKQLQKLKLVKDPVMRDTECKASSCKNTENGNDDEDTDVSLFEESLSMSNCDDSHVYIALYQYEEDHHN